MHCHRNPKSVKRDKLLAFFSGLPKCLVGLVTACETKRGRRKDRSLCG